MTEAELIGILTNDAVEGSKALLGAVLVKGAMRAQIVETEAYRHIDPACHAYGKTKMKNMALWSAPGNSYLYFTYGNHWMLNVVAEPEGIPAAVLIRAARPLGGIGEMQANRGRERIHDLLSGPGKLAQAFGLNASNNELPLIGPEATQLRIMPADKAVENVLSGPRIGIAVGKWHDVDWRFMDGENVEWVSRPIPAELRKNKKAATPSNIEK